MNTGSTGKGLSTVNERTCWSCYWAQHDGFWLDCSLKKFSFPKLCDQFIYEPGTDEEERNAANSTY